MTLLRFIQKKEARLLFGKKELEIIEKQILGKHLTPSEKTRLSRDIRKKLSAIEEMSRYKKEFPLKKYQEIKKRIEEAKETILQNFKKETKEIILFGSFAKKTNIDSSDIDICLKLNNTKKNSTKIRARLLGQLSEHIDLQIYSELPKKIRKQIDEEGKIIFKNEQTK